MNTHHRQMKVLAQSMQNWTQSKLSHLGIFESVYCYFNIHTNTSMTIPTFLNWHYSYLEQNLDLSIALRLNTGIHSWQSQDIVYQKYKSFTKKELFKKIDIVKKTANGFELMSFAHSSKLSNLSHRLLENGFIELSRSAAEIRTSTPSALTDLRPHKQVSLKYKGLDPNCFENYLQQ